MLKIINTKLLLAVLIALTAMGVLLIHIHNNTARAAAILQQQQDESNAAIKHDVELREFIRKQHEKNNAYPTNGSQTMGHYIP